MEKLSKQIKYITTKSGIKSTSILEIICYHRTLK